MQIHNEKMRSILVDWLVDVHLKFKLRQETLFLTVNLLDRFLSKQRVAQKKLQLVGIGCMMVAAKYVEMYHPEVRDYFYICDMAYTRHQIVQMEELVLNRLEFRLSRPTPYSWVVLEEEQKKEEQEQKEHERLRHTIFYILETSLVRAPPKYSPSLHVAGATMLAKEMLQSKGKGEGAEGKGEGKEKGEEGRGEDGKEKGGEKEGKGEEGRGKGEKQREQQEADVVTVCNELRLALSEDDDSTLKAVRKKYSSVALLLPTPPPPLEAKKPPGGCVCF